MILEEGSGLDPDQGGSPGGGCAVCQAGNLKPEFSEAEGPD